MLKISNFFWERKLIILWAYCVFLISYGAIAAERVTVLQPAECRNGMGKFRDHFKAYFNGVAEKYIAMKEEEILELMKKDGPESQDLGLIAVPALPEGFESKARRMACWSRLYDFNEELGRSRNDSAANHLQSWRACASGLYEGNPPAIVGDIKLCFDTARKSGVIPTVLPQEVKQPPKLEPNP